MPSIDEANLRLNTDTFRLQFTSGGLYDALMWLADSTNLISWATVDFFFRQLDAPLTGARAITAFTFVDNLDGTADLTWTMGASGSLVLRATPMTDWIKFEIITPVRATATDVFTFKLYPEAPTFPQQYSTSNVASNKGDLGLAFNGVGTALAVGIIPGVVTNRAACARITGGIQLCYEGRNWTDAQLTNETFGIFVAPRYECSRLVRTVLTGLGAPTSGLDTADKNADVLFITDYSGTLNANKVNNQAKLWGCSHVMLIDQLWRDHDNKFQPRTGIATFITALKNLGLKVICHVYPWMWYDGASGAGSYNDAAYAGQSQLLYSGTAYPDYRRAFNFSDTYAHGLGTGLGTTPTAIEQDIPSALAAGYAAAGFNGGVYFDAIDVVDQSLDDGLGGESPVSVTTFPASSYYATHSVLMAHAASLGPIWGASACIGIGAMLMLRARTVDDLFANTTKIAAHKNSIAGYLADIGRPADWGWAVLHPSGWNTLANMQAMIAAKDSTGGGFTWEGTSLAATPDFTAALSNGLNPWGAVRKKRRNNRNERNGNRRR